MSSISHFRIFCSGLLAPELISDSFLMQFVEIQYAYSVLSDEHRRFIYDQHGEEATRKYEEATRQNKTVFSPNPALARKIWMVFFGIWLGCVLLDPLLGVSLEWYEFGTVLYCALGTASLTAA